MQKGKFNRYFWETQKQKMFGEGSSWFWEGIFLPFLGTRLVLVLAAWFARYFQPDPGYAKYTEKGFFLSPYFLVDIWSRWDARYYLGIIKNGYILPKGFPDVYSNIAFFPLYPVMVKYAAQLLPHGLRTDSMTLGVGLALSNLCLLGGLAMLYRLATQYLGRSSLSARQAVLLVLLFPAGFFFSCFYSEGLFLLLSVGAFYFALGGKWPLAGLLGGLAALTRLQGVVLLLPLAWIYMDTIGWRVREARSDAFWLGLVPFGLGLHMYQVYTLSGELTTILKAQNAWSKPAWFAPAQLMAQLNSDYAPVMRIDTAIAAIFLVCAVILIWKRPTRAMGVYTLAMLAVPLAGGRLISLGRFMAVLFPAFIVLGSVNRPRWLVNFLYLAFFAVQVMYWVGWQNYYFIN